MQWERASGHILDWFSGAQGLRKRCGLAPLLFSWLFTAVLRVIVEGFSVNADAGRDMVYPNVKDEGGGGGEEARKAGRKGEVGPKRQWQSRHRSAERCL